MFKKIISLLLSAVIFTGAISIFGAMPASASDFETQLKEAGFPSIYISKLTELHNKYPNWKFEAQQTNLNWEDAITGESALGKNLVHTSSISSWKSTQNGAYDWETGEWTVFDSGGWSWHRKR